MLTTYTFQGVTFQRRAWTGGHERIWPHGGHLIPSVIPAFNYIRQSMYREQLGDWFAYWGDLPDRDTRNLFWRRATYDASRTIISHYERRGDVS